MRIIEPPNRLSYDVEDFLSVFEVKENLKCFEALIDAKLQILKLVLLEHFKPITELSKGKNV